uniref:Uncharacterized protein n=1 Tax=Astyanax mexicanus TaxID=7994 RepID=W5KUJ9_ASTMX
MLRSGGCVGFLSCPVCLERLRDPVTIPCGHSYCKRCISQCWDEEQLQKKAVSCPQCRGCFPARPALNRSTVLSEVLDSVEPSPAEPRGSSPGSASLGGECNFCSGAVKSRAVKSCLTCVASFCETHLRPHLQFPVLQRHALVEATSGLQEMICSRHNKLLEVFCVQDKRCICLLCAMDEHSGHTTVSAAKERASTCALFSRGTFRALQDVNPLLCKVLPIVSLQTVVPAAFRSFANSCRVVSGRFLTVLSIIATPRDYCQLKLSPDSCNSSLQLSEENRKVQFRSYGTYSTAEPHADRFIHTNQVLCDGAVRGCCYWEVKWQDKVNIALSYGSIVRNACGDSSKFGYNDQSWSLECDRYFCKFRHNSIVTDVSTYPPEHIGVYLDEDAGVLAFYRVCSQGPMTLLYKTQAEFTKPLYPERRNSKPPTLCEGLKNIY